MVPLYIITEYEALVVRPGVMAPDVACGRRCRGDAGGGQGRAAPPTFAGVCAAPPPPRRLTFSALAAPLTCAMISSLGAQRATSLPFAPPPSWICQSLASSPATPLANFLRGMALPRRPSAFPTASPIPVEGLAHATTCPGLGLVTAAAQHGNEEGC